MNQRQEEPQGPAEGSQAPALDADMLEFVQKFESNYAQFAPAPEESRQRPVFGDDMFPAFPEPVEVGPARARASDSAPAPRREPELLRSPKTIAAVTAQVDRRFDDDGDVDLEEAYSMLRAAEVKGAGEQQRGSFDSVSPVEEQKRATAAPTAPQQQPTAQPVSPEPAVQRSGAGADWATKSHRPRSIAVGAAVLALVVGIGVGYVAGRSPDRGVSAQTGASQQVSPQLKLDYDLRKR
jgi:hypothetical protein